MDHLSLAGWQSPPRQQGEFPEVGWGTMAGNAEGSAGSSSASPSPSGSPPELAKNDCYFLLDTSFGAIKCVFDASIGSRASPHQVPGSSISQGRRPGGCLSKDPGVRLWDKCGRVREAEPLIWVETYWGWWEEYEAPSQARVKAMDSFIQFYKGKKALKPLPNSLPL